MAEVRPPEPTPPDDQPPLADMVDQLEALEAAATNAQLTPAEHAVAVQGLRAAIEARRTALRLYERDGETYRAHGFGVDDGPPLADYLVRRDSDARFGGYIADLSQDGDTEPYGPEDLRYEAYDDRGQYLASTSSIRGALSVFAQPNRGIRWIADRPPEPELEAGA
jgi:hypothetical protein